MTTTSASTKPHRSYLVLSDIHLGARTTTATEILNHLTTFFDDFSAKSPFCKVKVIFIAGDLWDDTLAFADELFGQFLPWFLRFLRWCSLYGIKLRIMEGTPRHDRKQAATLAKIVDMLHIEIDFKYVSELSIEYIDGLDMSVLYVPDECRHTAAVVERDVEALFTEHNLAQVDIAIMHGMFKYQLGTIPMNSKVHDEEWYLEKVKNYISIGHIHTYSQYSRIVAEGSFDRLAHGEESPKGAVLFQETEAGEWVYFFIENTHAKVYKTITVKGDIESALTTIDKALRKIPFGSYIRIQAPAVHPIFQGFETLRQKYPLFTFSKKATVKDVEKVSIQPVNYTPIVLSKDTLTEAICEEVAGQSILDVDEYQALRGLLETLHS